MKLLSQFRKLFKRTRTIEFYVPSTNGSQESNAELLTARTTLIATRMSHLAGGATILPAVGFWLGDHDTPIEEKINVVRTFTDEDILADVLAMAREFVELWEQEAILVTQDNKPHFIS